MTASRRTVAKGAAWAAPVVAVGAAAPAFAASCPPVTRTFAFTGAVQTTVVPACATRATFTVTGGSGGNPNATASRSFADVVTGTLVVTGGATLNLYVGGQGQQQPAGSTLATGGYGFGSGGNVAAPSGSTRVLGAGGGGSAITGATGTLVVAGGGGGLGSYGGQTSSGTGPTALGGNGGAGSYFVSPNDTGTTTAAASAGGGGGGSTGGGGGGCLGVSSPASLVPQTNQSYEAAVAGYGGGGASFIAATVLNGSRANATAAGNGSISITFN